MIKKTLALLTVVALVVGLMPLQLNAAPAPASPRIEVLTYYPNDSVTIDNIAVGPNDTFEASIMFDKATLENEEAYLLDFYIEFPKNELTLIGLQAFPFTVDPNTGIPINLTDVYYPNDTGLLHFQFDTNPYGLKPFPEEMVKLTFQVKSVPTPGNYNIQPVNTRLWGINGLINNYQQYSATVNIVDFNIEVLNIEIKQPVSGEVPQRTVTGYDYSGDVFWLKMDYGTYETLPDTFDRFENNTAYVAQVIFSWTGHTAVENLMVLINGEAPESRSDTPQSKEIEVIKEFPPTSSLPGITGGVNLSTLTPGFADSNPIDAHAFSSLPNVLPFHYRWYRDGVLIPNSDNRKHTVVLADIGKRLRVEVYSDNYSGFITSQTTAVVTKGQQNVIPPVPAQLSATANSITILNKKSDQEYGISTSDTAPTTWGFADFTNLAANTDYYVFTRLAEKPGLFPGPAVNTHIKTERIEQVISGPSSKAIHINASLDLDTLYRSNVVGANLDYSIVSNTADGTVLTDNVLQAGTTGGAVVIRVSADEIGDYAAATKDVTINVSAKLIPQFAAGFTDDVTKHYGEAPFTKAANLRTGDGVISYSSDNSAVAVVNTTTGAVTITGVGEANISAHVAETATYASDQQSYLLKVLKANLVVDQLPSAVVNHGKLLTTATFSGGVVISETTGQEVAGTWQFNSTDTAVYGLTMAYPAKFTPSDNADSYAPLTVSILPTIQYVDVSVDNDDDDNDDNGDQSTEDEVEEVTMTEFVRGYFPNVDVDEFTQENEDKLVVAQDKDALITLDNGVTFILPAGSEINRDGTINVAEGALAQIQLPGGGMKFHLRDNLVLVDSETFPLGYVPTQVPQAIDVPSDASYYDAVNFGIAHGIFIGMAENQFIFSPEEKINRAMFVTVLHRLAGNEPPNQNQVFSDVAGNVYYYQPVQWAVGEGIIEGYPNGLFGANDRLTKEQLATIIYRFLKKNNKLKPTDIASEAAIDGAFLSQYAEMAVNFCIRNGIMDNSLDGYFSPHKPVTRADAAVIIKNLIDYYVTVEE